jgi:hypothetical protein
MRYSETLLCSVDRRATARATLTTVITGHLPPGKGHSKRNKLYCGISKRVCRKYIAYCTGNQGYCLVVYLNHKV